MTELARKTCAPCSGSSPPLEGAVIEQLARDLDQWTIQSGHHLAKTVTFTDFAQALAFVDQIGAIAEEQGHHPEIHLTWGRVDVEIWTHKVNGLTESDFILAAKIDDAQRQG